MCFAKQAKIRPDPELLGAVFGIGASGVGHGVGMGGAVVDQSQGGGGGVDETSGTGAMLPEVPPAISETGASATASEAASDGHQSLDQGRGSVATSGSEAQGTGTGTPLGKEKSSSVHSVKACLHAQSLALFGQWYRQSPKFEIKESRVGTVVIGTR